MVFLGPKTNVNLVHQIDVARRACHAAAPSRSTMSPYSSPSNTKLSPDAKLLCFALPLILPSSFFSAPHCCLMLAFIRRASGHSVQTFRSVIRVLPISCSFPSYSYYFALLSRVTWTVMFCASSRTYFLRFYSSAVRFRLTGQFSCRINFGNWIFSRCWVRLMGPAQILCRYKTIQSVECVASPFAQCSSGYGRAERPTGVLQLGDCSCWHGVYSWEKLTQLHTWRFASVIKSVEVWGFKYRK